MLKRGGEQIFHVFFVCSRHIRKVQQSAPSPLPPSHPPTLSPFLLSPPPPPYLSFISCIPHFVCPSFMCSTIAATISSFGKPSITRPHLICPQCAPPHQTSVWGAGGAYTLLCATYNSHITTHRGKPNHFEDEFKRDPQFEYISISTCRNK